MTRARRSILGTLTVLAAAAVLAACSAPPASEHTPEPTVAESTAPPLSTPEPSPSVTAAGESTCESILLPETVADLEGYGWTAQETPFYAGAVELTGGIHCTWGDYTVASDHVQIYGWAPITDAQSETAQQELLSSGWTREDSADGIYITESADTAIATDGEGYGITYLFGDGWVTISDTKQGLVLIEPPVS